MDSISKEHISMLGRGPGLTLIAIFSCHCLISVSICQNKIKHVVNYQGGQDRTPFPVFYSVNNLGFVSVGILSGVTVD